jgi:hypothetical protein
MTPIRYTTDLDGRKRVYGWVSLAAPERERRLARARELWGTMPKKHVALVSGVPIDALRRAFEPGYAEHRAMKQRERVLRERSGEASPPRVPHVHRVVPEDDARSLTARLMGDPNPADQRRAGS